MAGFTYICLYIVVGSCLIITDYLRERQLKVSIEDVTYILEYIFLVSLLIAYTYTVITLYQKVKLLENMHEERKAIIKQVLAFYASLVSLLGFKAYSAIARIKVEQKFKRDEEIDMERLTFRICWIEVIVMTINKFVPLIYMLLTHMKTYHAGK